MHPLGLLDYHARVFSLALPIGKSVDPELYIIAYFHPLHSAAVGLWTFKSSWAD